MKQVIVIIGGYNSIWPAYLKMARDLEDLTGLQTIGVPFMPWHWWHARRAQEAANLLEKVEETVVWARRKFRAKRFVLIGHSAGGIIARLYLHDGPVWGHTCAGAACVTALVTLGSPHCDNRSTDVGWFLADEANRLAPGTPHVDQVIYRTVAGRHMLGREHGNYWEQRTFRTYQFFAGQGDVWGDGVVPVQCAGLTGAEALVLDNVAHSRKHGTNWYGGSKAIMRRWWPQVQASLLSEEIAHGK